MSCINLVGSRTQDYWTQSQIKNEEWSRLLNLFTESEILGVKWTDFLPLLKEYHNNAESHVRTYMSFTNRITDLVLLSSVVNLINRLLLLITLSINIIITTYHLRSQSERPKSTDRDGEWQTHWNPSNQLKWLGVKRVDVSPLLSFCVIILLIYIFLILG